MKKLDLNRLNTYNIEDNTYDQRGEEKAVEDFAVSNLSNEYFVRHLTEKYVVTEPIFYNKGLWHNFAKILIKRGYPTIKDVLPQLFIWLQDITWPGAIEIYEFLLTIPKNERNNLYNQSLAAAIDSNDETWIDNLNLLNKEVKMRD